MNVAELTDEALDWAVGQIDKRCAGLRWEMRESAMCGVCIGEGIDGVIACFLTSGGFAEQIKLKKKTDAEHYSPTSAWAQGGPIMDREGINHGRCDDGQFCAWIGFVSEYEIVPTYYGPTTLIAAMRCYVATLLGDEIAIPKELLS